MRARNECVGMNRVSLSKRMRVRESARVRRLSPTMMTETYKLFSLRSPAHPSAALYRCDERGQCEGSRSVLCCELARAEAGGRCV